MTVADVSKAQRFLALHGQGSAKMKKIPQPIVHMNRLVSYSLSNKPVDAFSVKSLEREEKEKMMRALVPNSAIVKTDRRQIPRMFDIDELRCGQWDYNGQDLIFHDYYRLELTGQITFGPGGLFVTMSSKEPQFHPGNQLEMSYRSIDSYTTGSQKDPSLTFSLREAPKIFEKVNSDTVSTNNVHCMASAPSEMFVVTW